MGGPPAFLGERTMAIYLKYDGIDGDVTTKGYEKQIELLSATLAASRSIRISARREVNRETSEPSMSELHLAKEWDPVSSSKLFEESVAGKLNHKAVITFTNTVEGTVEKYLEIELTDAGVSDLHLSAAGEGAPSESISLNFAKIEYKPFTVGADKIAKAGKAVSYNLSKMKANG